MDTKGHLSKFTLESILAGEIDPDKDPGIKKHLLECESCAAYVASAPERSFYFKKKYPDWASLKKTEFRGKCVWSTFRVSLFPVQRLAAAVLALLVFVGGYFYLRQPEVSLMQIKGKTVFSLWINGNPASNREDTLLSAPGDTLKWTVTSTETVSCAIFYRDDGKSLARYLPIDTLQPSRVGNANGEALPSSIVLEPGWQREVVYCIASKSPFSCGYALKALEAFVKGDSTLLKQGGFEFWLFHLRNRQK